MSRLCAGSSNGSSSSKIVTTRKDVVQEAIRLLVGILGEYDSETKHEAEGGELRTITFANGSATDAGDWNADNIATAWNALKVWRRHVSGAGLATRDVDIQRGIR
jgi:hypothetical protein